MELEEIEEMTAEIWAAMQGKVNDDTDKKATFGNATFKAET